MAKAGIQTNYRGELTGCVYSFNGINNIIDSTNINLEDGEVVDAVNIDFDNTSSINRRQGYKQIYSGAYHSGWNNITKDRAYIVLNNFIYEYDGSYLTPVQQVTADLHMEFCQVNDVVVYSNGVDFGVLNSNLLQTRTYSPDFKTNTQGGRNLEFYNGRLYYSRENKLYCTDVFDVEHTDTRYNMVAVFPDAITMCQRVEDGLWIGTEEFLYFLRGDDFRDGGFQQEIIAKVGVLYGTAYKVNAEYVPAASAVNTVILVTTRKGICALGDSSKYVNLSWQNVSYDADKSGTAIVRYTNGILLYTVCFDKDMSAEYSPYNVDFTIDVNTI